MGLTSQYLRFVPGAVFGIVASPCANILLFDSADYKNCVAVPACENVLMWNYRILEIINCFKGDKHCVTCITSEKTQSNLTVGYFDGAIRVFDTKSGKLRVLFQGHKSPVSCLGYDSEGFRLASGGKDTEIVIWDVVGEQGLFRLKGHKGPITKCQFLNGRNVLLSSSEDTLMKLWDLDSQHCFKTLIGNRDEIWDFLLLRDQRLVTGINEADLRVWDLVFKEFHSTPTQTDDDDDAEETLAIKEVGKILTTDERRTVSLQVDNRERLMGCHGNSNCLQLFKLLTDEEAKKKMKKRKKKERKQGIGDENDLTIMLNDQIIRLKPVQMEAKIIAFSMETENVSAANIAILLKNNCFTILRFDLLKECEPIVVCSVKSPGHRTNVSTLAFSSDSQLLLSASGESLKIWNWESSQCTHTFQSEYALCSAFVTGNNHCIIGTKSGKLIIFDLSMSHQVETIDAHADAVSCLCQTASQSGITSGSKDKDIKFWNYELVKDPSYSETKKHLTLCLTQTLRMPEEILCLKHCPKQKFLALSLLDCTVKVLFCDTLKFAFSLYGHRLPVTCIDISYDSTILISGSKDRNIKIWNMEFGNCLKSIFAHEESITCLQFLPKTHMFFSGGKDKTLKQWDADNFQKILTLEGHQGKVNAVSVSPDGRTVATCSDDRSIRMWEKTDELLILEEERQNTIELEADTQLALEEVPIAGESNEEVGLAAKKTIETIKSAEQLIEAIDIYQEETFQQQEHELQCRATGKVLPLPAPHPLLTAYSLTCPYRYMLKILQKIRSSNLEQTLLNMPFSYAVDFLKILTELLTRVWEIELCTRCVLFLLRIHLRQLLTSREMLPIVDKLRKLLHKEVAGLKDTIGFNIAGQKFLQREREESENVCSFSDTSQIVKRKSRKRHLINFV